ncbi:hypothetical protein NOCA2360002 [metagenome]|uniref:Aldehyde dehydrogenase domain-containing protein n=1 Tax=metagenome TaxID=256318 RepID=A0A2P2C3W9_9ZZZZ
MHGPFIVLLPDADLDAAVTSAMVARFRGGGQAGTAANSFHVHADIAPDFTHRLANAVRQLTVRPG